MVSSTVRDESEKVATQTDIPTNTETTISHTHTHTEPQREADAMDHVSIQDVSERDAF